MRRADIPGAGHRLPAVLFRSIVGLLALQGTANAAQVVIDGPAGSGEFGRTVTTLPNGNIVITDPGFDAPGPIVDAGAVYLYRPDGTLVSTLRGSSANDRVREQGSEYSFGARTRAMEPAAPRA